MANGCDIGFIAVTSTATIVTVTFRIITGERDGDATVPRGSYVWPVNYRHQSMNDNSPFKRDVWENSCRS